MWDRLRVSAAIRPFTSDGRTREWRTSSPTLGSIQASCLAISRSPTHSSRSGSKTLRGCTERNGNSGISCGAAATTFRPTPNGTSSTGRGARTTCSRTRNGGYRTIRPNQGTTPRALLVRFATGAIRRTTTCRRSRSPSGTSAASGVTVPAANMCSGPAKRPLLTHLG